MDEVSVKANYILPLIVSDHNEDLIIEKHENIGIIALNRPRVLNALTLPMINKMYRQLIKWENDGTQAVFVKSVTSKSFCSGGDLKKLISSVSLPSGSDAIEFFRREYTLNYLINRLHIPYISLINGIVMGGGVGISIHGTFRIASNNSLFAMPETAIGLFPDVGATYFLPRLREGIGLYLGLTGSRLSGWDLVRSGVATHFIPEHKLQQFEKELLETTNLDRNLIDSILTRYQNETSKDLQVYSLEPYLDKIDQYFNKASSVEEIMENLSKDPCEWAQTKLSVLKKMSPTSLKITFSALKKAIKLSRRECFEMEFRAAINLLRGKDLYEGIRSVVIDKDRNPKWQPKTLEEINDDVIDEYFKSQNHFQDLCLQDDSIKEIFQEHNI